MKCKNPTCNNETVGKRKTCSDECLKIVRHETGLLNGWSKKDKKEGGRNPIKDNSDEE